MAVPRMAIFMKIQEFTLAIIFAIFPQNWQFRLRNESFEKFLGIHPKLAPTQEFKIKIA